MYQSSDHGGYFGLHHPCLYEVHGHPTVGGLLGQFREAFLRCHALSDRAAEVEIGEPVEVSRPEAEAAVSGSSTPGYFDQP